jgi:hypothetical protein
VAFLARNEEEHVTTTLSSDVLFRPFLPVFYWSRTLMTNERRRGVGEAD